RATATLLLLSPSALSSRVFPYTTLFRSGREVSLVQAGQPRRQSSCPSGQHEQQPAGERVERSSVPGPRSGPPADPERGPGTLERDRKSTRLNSSHGSISYAVFCLKKKTI